MIGLKYAGSRFSVTPKKIFTTKTTATVNKHDKSNIGNFMEYFLKKKKSVTDNAAENIKSTPSPFTRKLPTKKGDGTMPELNSPKSEWLRMVSKPCPEITWYHKKKPKSEGRKNPPTHVKLLLRFL